MKKYRNSIATVLVLAVMITLLAPMGNVYAANKISYALQDSKTVLENNEYTMKVGESQDFKFIGAPSNWRKLVKGWSSSNEEVATVDKMGVVTAKSQGTAYIKVNLGKDYTDTLKITVGNTVTLGTASQRAMSTLYLENPGETFDLNFYGVSNWNTVKKTAKRTWKSSDTKVATVDGLGVVKAVAPGTATISLSIRYSNGAEIEAVPCVVTVDKTKVVADQKELESALKDTSVTKVVIRTDAKTEINIPEGEYKNTKLVVDAPNAEIKNSGLFSAISITQIAKDTFIEMRIGNRILVFAPTAHIVVAEGAKIDSIRVVDTDDNTSDASWTGANSTTNGPSLEKKTQTAINIEVKGSVGDIVLDTKTAVTLDVAGTVESVAVNTALDIEIKGETKEAIAVTVSDTADGTKLNSNVKVEVETASQTDITLAGGAEGSTVVSSDEKKTVAVENNTKSDIAVQEKKDGEIKGEVKVATGEKSSTDVLKPTPTNTPVPTNTPTPEPTATDVPYEPYVPYYPDPTATNTPVPTAAERVENETIQVGEIECVTVTRKYVNDKLAEVWEYNYNKSGIHTGVNAYFYNEAGFQTGYLWIAFAEDGETATYKFQREYFHNESGKLTKQIVTEYDNGTTVSEKSICEYSYDEKGAEIRNWTRWCMRS